MPGEGSRRQEDTRSLAWSLYRSIKEQLDSHLGSSWQVVVGQTFSLVGQYQDIIQVSAPAPPSWFSSTFLLLLHLPAPAPPSCSTLLILLHPPAPAPPSYSCSTFLLLLLLHPPTPAPAPPSCSCSFQVLLGDRSVLAWRLLSPNSF